MSKDKSKTKVSTIAVIRNGGKVGPNTSHSSSANGTYKDR